MNKYLVELIGTFFLVLTIGCTVISGLEHMAPLAIGTALMVMIYAGGHISGGHYNPGVTLACFLRGKCSAADLIPYWVSQVLGAVLAAFVVKYLYGAPETAAAAITGDGVGKSLLAEFLFSFAIAWMVLNVATAKGTEGNSFYGLAIGFTVLMGAYAVGGISGGAFNSAVAVGAGLMDLIHMPSIWIHVAANLVGGVIAALAFKSLAGDQG